MTHDRRLIKNIVTFLKFISNDLRINIIEFLDGKTRSYDQIKNDLNVDEEKLKGQIEILRKADFIIQEANDNQIFYKIKDKRIIKILELLYSYCSQLNKEKLKNIEDLDVIDTLL